MLQETRSSHGTDRIHKKDFSIKKKAHKNPQKKLKADKFKLH